MAEKLAKDAADIFAVIDDAAGKTNEKLESVVTLGEMTGTTTVMVGKCAIEGADLQLATVDTKIPSQDLRSTLVIATDYTKGVHNSGYLRLFHIDETTGVLRLATGDKQFAPAAPSDIAGVGAVLAKTDFDQPAPILELKRRIEQDGYTGPTQFIDAITDPRPLV